MCGRCNSWLSKIMFMDRPCVVVVVGGAQQDMREIMFLLKITKCV
jgi:hypothetical protein